MTSSNTTCLPSSNMPKQRIRIAVFAFFIAQGLCFATFFSRLPDIKAHFGIDDISHLGYLLSLIPIGKFLAIPTVGVMLSRFQSKVTTTISLLGFIISLVIIGTTNNIYLLGVILFIFGMFWNMTDISLNTQAIEVERIYDKPIIATFHASWSIAACIGALIGYLMINLNIISAYHFIIIAFSCVVIVLINYRYLREPEPVYKTNLVKPKDVKVSKFKLIDSLLIQLGIIWLLALIVENTMFDWSDIYFQSVIKAPKSLQIGFLVFMVMMSIGRLLINAAYRVWSKNTVLIVAGCCIFAGFFTSSMLIHYVDDITTKVVVNSIGFMFIGLGVSCIVPTLYSIVGEKATIPVGTALTIMSSISFIGPLIAPSLVGFISKYFRMDIAYLIISVFGLCIVALVVFSKTLRRKG